MHIVIDISEEMYEELKYLNVHGFTTAVEEAVANGTPLPKGHGRIVDVNTLIAYMRYASVRQKYKELAIQEHLTVDDVFEAIIGTLENESILAKEKVPTIIPADTESED